MADETKKDEWDTTQWYEVKKGDTKPTAWTCPRP